MTVLKATATCNAYISTERLQWALGKLHMAMERIDNLHHDCHKDHAARIVRLLIAERLVVEACTPLPRCNDRPDRDVFFPCDPQENAAGWWKCSCGRDIFPPSYPY